MFGEKIKINNLLSLKMDQPMGEGHPQEKEEIMTSIAQAIGQEYEQRGMQQGMHTKSLEIAKNMLSKLHLDIKAVKEATGLSEEELMKLQEEAAKEQH